MKVDDDCSSPLEEGRDDDDETSGGREEDLVEECEIELLFLLGVESDPEGGDELGFTALMNCAKSVL